MAHVIIRDIKAFQINPVLSVDDFNGVPATLFGKSVAFRDDEWLRNIHIKLTDRCNAKCHFCIEQDSHVKEDKNNLLINLKALLDQMSSQGLLFSASITGGEPLLCSYLQDVLNLLSKYEVFLTMNTTGYVYKPLHNAPDWINISKHAIDDSGVFRRQALSKSNIIDIKQQSGSKIRLQGVLLNGYLDSIHNILYYMEVYKDTADDFSFRQLIQNGSVENTPSLTPFRLWLKDNAVFVEQVIQDYYVYEIWNLDGKSITLSFSDMQMLAVAEKIEPAGFLREVVVHPDGLVSGDWGRKNKVLTDSI